MSSAWWLRLCWWRSQPVVPYGPVRSWWIRLPSKFGAEFPFEGTSLFGNKLDIAKTRTTGGKLVFSLRIGAYRARDALFREDRIPITQERRAVTGLAGSLQDPGKPGSLHLRNPQRMFLPATGIPLSLLRLGPLRHARWGLVFSAFGMCGRLQSRTSGLSKGSLQVTPGSSAAPPGSDSFLRLFHVQKKKSKTY